jgi:hypothetical protein
MESKDHWTYHEYLHKLSKKVLGFQHGLKKPDIVPILNASIVVDNECAKKLLSIEPDEITKIIAALDKAGKKTIANKLTAYLCYIEQIKKLSEINLRELVGLTRDDVAAMQRMTTLTPVAQGKRKDNLLSLLTELMLDSAEAESLDQEIEGIKDSA